MKVTIEIKMFEISYDLVIILDFLCRLINITVYVHEK